MYPGGDQNIARELRSQGIEPTPNFRSDQLYGQQQLSEMSTGFPQSSLQRAVAGQSQFAGELSMEQDSWQPMSAAPHMSHLPAEQPRAAPAVGTTPRTGVYELPVGVTTGSDDFVPQPSGAPVMPPAPPAWAAPPAPLGWEQPSGSLSATDRMIDAGLSQTAAGGYRTFDGAVPQLTQRQVEVPFPKIVEKEVRKEHIVWEDRVVYKPKVEVQEFIVEKVVPEFREQVVYEDRIEYREVPVDVVKEVEEVQYVIKKVPIERAVPYLEYVDVPKHVPVVKTDRQEVETYKTFDVLVPRTVVKPRQQVIQVYRQRMPDGSVRTWPPGAQEQCEQSQQQVQQVLDQLETENKAREREALEQRVRALVREEQEQANAEAGLPVAHVPQGRMVGA